jgi:predicted PurR-regulated permease PerM
MEESIYWVLFWFALGFLFLQWKWLWLPYLLDSFRNRIFVLRDELFDFSLQGGSNFDSQEYRTLRDQMNSSLRFVQKLGVIELLMVWFFVPNFKELALKEGERLENIFQAIEDKKSKEFYEDIRFRYNREIVRYFVISSPILIFVFLAVLCCLAIDYGMKQSLKASINLLSKKIEPQIEYSDHLIGKMV